MTPIITQEKPATTKANTETTTPTTPTSFLSLPREIRQKILIQSYRRFLFLEAFKPRPPYMVVILARQSEENYKSKCRHEMRVIEDWAKGMGTVHPIVRDDMRYVYKKVVDRAGLNLMKGTQGGRKSIGFCNGD